MRYLLLLLLFVCGTAFAGDFIFKYITPNPVIGEHKKEAVVIFHTDKYNVESCLRKENPKLRKGFSVAQIVGTNTITYLCGTKHKRGDKIYINIPEGI